MIYDCFTFFNELDLLEIRLNILNDVVDKFVIIESTKNHAGKEKPLNFDIKLFQKFKDKIIYEVFDNYPPFENAWVNENLQRNHILNVLKKHCKEDDIIILSDLDEIPNPGAIIEYKNNYDGIMTLEQKFYYYFLNMQNISTPTWYFAKIFKYKDFYNNENDRNYTYSIYLPEKYNTGITPNKIRMMKNIPIITKGGWHFSYLGGVDKIIEKLKSFAHQEFNNSQYLNKDKISKLIEKGEDILGRNYQYKIVKINNDFPTFICKHQKEYEKYIYKKTFMYKYYQLLKFIKHICLFIFEIKNEYNKEIKHKVIKIFGFKIKIRKNK